MGLFLMHFNVEFMEPHHGVYLWVKTILCHLYHLLHIRTIFQIKGKKNLQIIEFLVPSSHTAQYPENTVITLELMYCLCYLYHPLHASAHAPKSTSAKTSHAPLAQSYLLGISTFAHDILCMSVIKERKPYRKLCSLIFKIMQIIDL